MVVVPVGAVFGGFLMDGVGRLNTVKLAAIPGALGWTLIATAQNVPMIIAGRILTGLASSKYRTIKHVIKCVCIYIQMSSLP